MWGHHLGCCYSWPDGPVFYKFYKKWSWVSLYLGVTQSVMFFHNLCFSSSSQISAQISHEEGLWAGSQDRNQNNLFPPKLYLVLVFISAVKSKLKTVLKWGLTDSAVKRTNSSTRESIFDSQHPHSGSQLSVTAIQGQRILGPFLASKGTLHECGTQTHANQAHMKSK